ncbi:MAG TPA: aminotransferase class IV [Candidatus Eisenbacteria bacterium]|nr:aminotransferase class IV [Candidatus Eisenbacteria bacterium]
MDEKVVYLNGSFLPESEAKVSVLDYGFNAGDGVYDVTRTFGHKPFKLREHTERLFRSLRYTRIDCGLSVDQMEQITAQVLEKNKPLLGKDEEVALWQVVSRGVRSSEGDRGGGRATVTVYCVKVNFREFARHYVEGAKLVIPSTRRIPPQCLESKAKVTNKMNHNMALFEARQVDPHAIPLMLDIHGNLSESNAHNVFLVIDDRLCTPTDKNVLGGITRDTLISIAKENSIEVVEGDFTPYDLYNADEVFLASTSPTIVPIQSVNGVTIGKQAPGPVTRRLLKAWGTMVGVDIVAQALGALGDEGKTLLRIWEERWAA